MVQATPQIHLLRRGSASSAWLKRFFSTLASVASYVSFVGATFAQTPTQPAQRLFVREPDLETHFVSSEHPRWEGAQLLGYSGRLSNSPHIYSISRTGKLEKTTLKLSDAARINIVDIAGSLAGEVAVVGSAYTNDERSTTFLARMSADLSKQTVTRLWPFCAVAVAFSPDGTLWAVGHLKDEANTRILSKHVLRRFDTSGRLVSSAVLQVRGDEIEANSFLRSSSDRVGWLTRDGQYIKFGLDGREMGRYEGPPGVAGIEFLQWMKISFALTSDGEAVLGRTNAKTAEMFVLQRQTKLWNQISLPSEAVASWSRIIGADGVTIVTNGGNNRLLRFRTK